VRSPFFASCRVHQCTCDVVLSGEHCDPCGTWCFPDVLLTAVLCAQETHLSGVGRAALATARRAMGEGALFHLSCWDQVRQRHELGWDGWRGIQITTHLPPLLSFVLPELHTQTTAFSLGLQAAWVHCSPLYQRLLQTLLQSTPKARTSLPPPTPPQSS
jgi:hypothetical protein